MKTEWDESKRLSNIDKHGIDFASVVTIFDGRRIVNVLTGFVSEQRFITTGILDGKFISVVWSERNGQRRLISARRARDDEEERYRFFHGRRDR